MTEPTKLPSKLVLDHNDCCVVIFASLEKRNETTPIDIYIEEPFPIGRLVVPRHFCYKITNLDVTQYPTFMRFSRHELNQVGLLPFVLVDEFIGLVFWIKINCFSLVDFLEFHQLVLNQREGEPIHLNLYQIIFVFLIDDAVVIGDESAGMIGHELGLLVYPQGLYLVPQLLYHHLLVVVGYFGGLEAIH
jgi:hypothetical protein